MAAPAGEDGCILEAGRAWAVSRWRGCECQLIRAVNAAMAHEAASVFALPWLADAHLTLALAHHGVTL